MRIACIGNTNHFMLSLTRMLRVKGYDAYLLLLGDEPDNFLPEADSFDGDYKTFTRSLSWRLGINGFYLNSKESLHSDLSDYDVLIGVGPVPAFVQRAGRVLDIFVPYGHDIYELPFKKATLKLSLHPKKMYSNIIWYKRYQMYYSKQRQGIKSSNHIFLDVTSPKFERVIDRLNIEKKRERISCPYLYPKAYEVSNDNPYSGCNIDIEELRTTADILVLSHGRQLWKNLPDEWSSKGNDILFKGLKRFLDSNSKIVIKLICCEYGGDVEHSKSLIRHLGIEDHIVWLPTLPRKDLLNIMRYVDLGVGTLSISWFAYTSLFEFLSMGVPVAHNRDDASYIEDYDEMYPMFFANSESSICEFFDGFIRHPEKYKQVGQKGKDWFEEYALNRPLEKCIKVLDR